MRSLLRRPSRTLIVLILASCCVLVLIQLSHQVFHTVNNSSNEAAKKDCCFGSSDRPITVILAGLKSSNITYISLESGLCESDQQIIYAADDPDAPYHTLINKGREAMPYLEYIISHYDKLPHIMLFMHAGRYAWHNVHLFRSSTKAMVRRLRREHVEKQGFVNLKCDWQRGCPTIFNDTAAIADGNRNSSATPSTMGQTELEHLDHLRGAWADLFPDVPSMPVQIGIPGGGQFAVTRELVMGVPLARWKKIQQWLIDTPLSTFDAGQVLEFSWHMFFLGTTTSVMCPDVDLCYCQLYGTCFERANATIDATTEPRAFLSSTDLAMTKFERMQKLLGEKQSANRDAEILDMSGGPVEQLQEWLSNTQAITEVNYQKFEEMIIDVSTCRI